MNSKIFFQNNRPECFFLRLVDEKTKNSKGMKFMRKIKTGIALFATGAIGFILSLEFATYLCHLFGAIVAAKCLLATAVFLLILFAGGYTLNKEFFVKA